MRFLNVLTTLDRRTRTRLLAAAVACGVLGGCLSAGDRADYDRTKALEKAAAGCLGQGKGWRMSGDKLECVPAQ